jgi:hypothetical protein
MKPLHYAKHRPPWAIGRDSKGRWMVLACFRRKK